MPSFTTRQEQRLRPRQASQVNVPTPRFPGVASTVPQASPVKAIESIGDLIATLAMVSVKASNREAQRSEVSAMNSATAALTDLQSQFETDKTMSGPDRVQAFQEGAIEIASRLSLENQNAFAPTLARSIRTINLGVSREQDALDQLERDKAVDNMTADSDIPNMIQQHSQTSDDAELRKFASRLTARRNELVLGQLKVDAVVANDTETLDRIDRSITQHSTPAMVEQNRFDIFGNAAKATAENGLIGRTKSLLNKLGNTYAAEQAKIIRTAETRNNDINHVGRLSTALLTGNVEPGQRLSVLPKHLDDAREAIAVQELSLGQQIDAFKRLSLPLAPSLEQDVKAAFDRGDVREGLAALQTLNKHSENEAIRLKDNIGLKAQVAWTEVHRSGATAKSKVDAIDTLSHPKADQLLKEAQVQLEGTDDIDAIVPETFIFAETRKVGFNQGIVVSSDQQEEIEALFRIKLIENSIRDGIPIGDLGNDAIRGAAARSAAAEYQQSFDPIRLFRGPDVAQLLSKSLGVPTQDLEPFQAHVTSFEKFANQDKANSRVLVHRTFKFRDATYTPAVDDMGGIIGFMVFDQEHQQFRNTSLTANTQEFAQVFKVFNEVLRPGQLDLYSNVRRRANESRVAFEAGGDSRVQQVMKIAARLWLIDTGESAVGREEEFQVYLDQAITRSGFDSLFPDEKN